MLVLRRHLDSGIVDVHKRYVPTYIIQYIVSIWCKFHNSYETGLSVDIYLSEKLTLICIAIYQQKGLLFLLIYVSYYIFPPILINW